MSNNKETSGKTQITSAKKEKLMFMLENSKPGPECRHYFEIVLHIPDLRSEAWQRICSMHQTDRKSVSAMRLCDVIENLPELRLQAAQMLLETLKGNLGWHSKSDLVTIMKMVPELRIEAAYAYLEASRDLGTVDKYYVVIEHVPELSEKFARELLDLGSPRHETAECIVKFVPSLRDEAEKYLVLPTEEVMDRIRALRPPETQ